MIGRHHGIRKLVEQEDSEWDLIMRVNLTGLMYCMRAQLRKMAELGPPKEGGSSTRSIVNAASIQGLRGFAKHAAYSASKH
ncbi:SDR family NAD(P)-dependent oxidoreductase, partial [Isoptericola croceus]|uniref:SDR family NAD(P)-dependent oxidoreductase n=1 Tax=Isoptericola croceus TaxID=3031406 RepID=UPI0023F7AB7C